ncbi:Blue-light-activated protein [Maioricimonas rarisocia]|uniref:histidine kinase n=1 Tax=Maioricimonas rarisocia TaxID=2528026 RepID=A0A517Z2Y4_9PLAN|nr:PAS domain S-box protein [Maioricimonas rarisocia]QDU36806.1 Blue-light-activated protein [Maioricimonas rarisocia]
MQSRVTRLLIVEESAIDAEMLVMHLRRDGARIEWKRADTFRELHSVLSDGTWDSVLCGGPDFDGELCLEEVLSTVRRFSPHVPVLLVAREIQLERAVTLMRTGVTDLMTRDQIDRLPDMVGRAVEQHRSSADANYPEQSGNAATRDARIFRHIRDAVIVLDADGTVTDWNAGATRLLGWTVEGMIGRPYLERFPAPERSRIASLLESWSTTPDTVAELEDWHRDGSRVWVSCRAVPLPGPDGQSEGKLLVLRDIRTLKRSEAALRASEQRYRELIETSHDLIWSVDTDGVITFMNKASLRIAGRKPEDVIGTRFIDFVPPEEVHSHVASFMETLQSGRDTIDYESRVYNADGGLITVSTRCRTITDDEGDVVGICGVSRDMTAEKESALALKKRESLLSNAERIGNMGSWELDLADGTLRWSEETLRIFGMTAEEFGGDLDSFLQRVHPDDRERIFEAHDRADTGDGIITSEYRILRPDGEERIIQGRGDVVFDEDGKPIRRMGVILDITELRRSEETLRLRNRAIQAVPHGIVITDPGQPDHPIVYASTGFEQLTGYTPEESVGRNCKFLQGPETSPEAVERLQQAVANGDSTTVELLNYRKDGTTFWNEVTISPVLNDSGELTHFVGVQIDVTRRRAMAEQLRQVQKMEAIGRLAGGIAHDFNNLLTVINGYSEILLDEMEPDDPSRELLDEIRKSGERSTELTRQLLAFSRKQVLAAKVFDLNTVVSGAERLLRRLIGEDLELITDLVAEPAPVRADPGQIEQVVLNLAVNARDAMPTGGTLTIRTRTFEVDEEFARGRPVLQPGPHLMLSIADTGCGMSPEVLAQIFEPFFTTKGTGAGTGLGLAVVHGIVTQSGGHIDVVSSPGQGTTFRILLPRDDEPLEESEPTTVETSDDELPRGTETVLLVEDEDGVRRFARQILADCGYAVLEAPDGTRALQLAADHEGPIQLLVTDVIMPGKGGREVAEELVAARPDLKVVFVSGYTDDAVVRHGVQESRVNFMHKPFAAVELARKVRYVLDSVPAAE